MLVSRAALRTAFAKPPAKGEGVSDAVKRRGGPKNGRAQWKVIAPNVKQMGLGDAARKRLTVANP